MEIDKRGKQTERMKKVFITAIIIVFAALSGVFFYMRTALPDYQFSALMGANIIMLVLVLLSFWLVVRQLDKKPAAFVRGVYSASLLKLMVCMFSVLIYALINKHNLHKPTLFVLFGIYAVYSATETILLSKMARVK
jgi:hypothetical protein